MKYEPLTSEEHVDIANMLSFAFHYLNQVVRKCEKHYPKTSPLMVQLYKIDPCSYTKVCSQVRHALDYEYQRTVSNEDFAKYGFIYNK